MKDFELIVVYLLHFRKAKFGIFLIKVEHSIFQNFQNHMHLSIDTFVQNFKLELVESSSCFSSIASKFTILKGKIK